MRLASRFGYANQIRRDRPLTHEEPRPVCATRAAGDTQNTCCVCGGPER